MNQREIEILKSEQELIEDLMLREQTSSQTIDKPIVIRSLPTQQRRCFECETMLDKEELFCGYCRRK